MTKDYILKTSDNYDIRITTYFTDDRISSNCLIFVHGFKGFKDWGFVPYLGDYFSEKGFLVVTFNFSHNGVSGNSTEFTEMNKFASNTVSREIDELLTIIDFCKNKFFLDIKLQKIGLIGHSRGGGVGLIASTVSKDIDAVTVWSSIAFFDRYSDRQKKEWRKNGYFEILNSRTNQIMRLNSTLLDDIENNKNDKFNLKKAVSALRKPLLIIHGEQDLTVPVNEAGLLYDWSDKSLTEFYKLNSAGHTFDIQHPFSGSNEKFDRILELTESFFSRCLIEEFYN